MFGDVFKYKIIKSTYYIITTVYIKLIFILTIVIYIISFKFCKFQIGTYVLYFARVGIFCSIVLPM